ncbi:hypothetical protein K438DRAFT_1962629 [Mycena galopus ATCC 62051]|nr:hypothetical protein K438DRAFT_1962629 [Mycena galopus ATCC 62051]
MSLRPRGNHKPPVADEIRTSLNVLKDSTHLLPYEIWTCLIALKHSTHLLPSYESARVPLFDEQLARRTLHILIRIFDAGGGEGPVSEPVLMAFEGSILREISAAMEEELKPGWLRVLHMQKRESQLPPLVVQLDFIFEVLKVAALLYPFR